MDLLIDRGYRTEIASPAGNLEKLKISVKYGADSVYFGGEFFNLRIKTGNFKLEDIEEAVKFCSKNHVKTTFLLNSYLHENNIKEAERYIDLIANFSFDGIMISDPGMLMLLKKSQVDTEIHLSTQMSTLNHLSIQFWNDIGIKRIVLARETTLDEIKMIRENTDAEIEVFIHGALCISYSGRCLLSRYLSGRNANQGSCSHPCRWKYSLVEEKRAGNHLDIIEHSGGTEILSSKDLCLISRIEDYIRAGVNSFKIEGRMKSLYYAANTTRIYRHAVETYYGNEYKEKYMPFWLDELDLISHRPYTEDLFNEFENGFTEIPYIKKVLFLGYSLSDSGDGSGIYVKAFNPIYLNDEIEAIFPIIENSIIDDTFVVKEINDGEKSVKMAQPGAVYLIKFDRPVHDNAIFRKRI